jgi:hypothetical protein
VTSWDGRQTPWHGSAIYYAQHATAACCRTCIEYWHGIPRVGDLGAKELDYLTDLVVRYLDERLPDLPADGQARSSQRRQKSGPVG